jgi:hypothetical protein
MSRYKFTEQREYAARLLRIAERPIENKFVRCLRIEFEIYGIEADEMGGGSCAP